MWDDLATFPYVIPIIWQGDGPNPSPNYSGRGSLYGVSGIPHGQWGGNQSYIGGGTGTLPGYTSLYNAIVTMNSPAEIDASLNTNEQGQLVIQADVELTGNITTTNNKIIFILTHDFEPGQLPDYFCSAITYDEQDFDLTTTGQTGFYESSAITLNPAWELAKIKAIAIIQTLSGNHVIHQAAITEFSGLLPMFTSNVTEGPAYLGVQFTSNSFPLTGIESWEWDFDGDGVFDSTEENPYHLYTDPGSYDVTLKIGVGGEYEETTVPDYINVTDGSNVSGDLSGVWVTDFSPYNVTDEVEIAEGDLLVIEPDVEVNFGSNVQLTVHGNLVADASTRDDEPIILTSSTEWAGLKFVSTQEANLIRNCEISKANVSAILIENDSYVEIIGNKIFDNSSGSLGAAIDVTSSDNVLISQNIIANNNSSSLTGGIGCISSSVEISNNLIVNNTGMYGAMSLKNGSDALIVNNTIANNESTSGNPYLFFLFNALPTIKNCIIIDNVEIFFAPFGDPEVTYTCITGGFTGTGNIDEDPLFVAPSAGFGSSYDGLNASWWLQEGSPCIDAGDPDPIYNNPDGSRNDMGAYGGPNGMTPTDAENNVVNIITKNSISVYPNPFNPQTNIALSITAKDIQHPVSVGIYNIKGQLVKTLVDNELVNNSTFIWDGTDNTGANTSSGMYFVKMKTVSNITAKKMILLK